MAGQVLSSDDYVTIRLYFESLIQALEDVSLRNKAYWEVIQKEPNRVDLMGRVTSAEETLRNLCEPEKYIDLRDRAKRALANGSFDELPQLGREVQERVQHWGKP